MAMVVVAATVTVLLVIVLRLAGRPLDNPVTPVLALHVIAASLVLGPFRFNERAETLAVEAPTSLTCPLRTGCVVSAVHGIRACGVGKFISTPIILAITAVTIVTIAHTRTRPYYGTVRAA